MKKRLIVIIILSYINLSGSNQSGIVFIEEYLGLLGNQLFQFCLGKILSSELNVPLRCSSIHGFPETFLYQDAQLSKNVCSETLTGHIIDLKRICADRTPRNIILRGIFARYEYFKKYKNKIKEWLRFDTPIKKHQNPNDIVLHIRIHPGTYMYLPPSYYEKALSSTHFDQVYICTNEPNDPFIKNFEKYKPIIKTTTSLNQLMEHGKNYTEIIQLTIEDFKFIMSFNKIVVAQSTFSWWAAFLSDAQEIFAPLPEKGIMSSERPDVQLTGIEEDRYTYISC